MAHMGRTAIFVGTLLGVSMSDWGDGIIAQVVQELP